MKNKLFVAGLFAWSIIAHADSYESDLGGLTLPCATCHGLPGEKNNAMNLYGIKEEIFLINLNLFRYYQIKTKVLCITYLGLIQTTIFDAWRLILQKSNSINQ
ncbi:MAG: hypothetical protein CM15mP58_02980 [Burkholderiaceae bacterium]|nr:MAG: hypothetical protein CM15mP58_02980 [Burkholderiaceae bacterium]